MRLRTLIVLFYAVGAVFAVQQGGPPPCTLCLSGICYDPPPTAVISQTAQQFRLNNGSIITLAAGSPLLAKPHPNLPPTLVWNATTCPIARPIRLYTAFGVPIPPNPLPTSMPGRPTTRPSPSYPGPVPPGPAGWPPHVFLCYWNTFNPWGPSGTTGAGGYGPRPPIPSGSTPTRPSSPAPVGPTGGTSNPPVPFGTDGPGATEVLTASGCYTEVNCNPNGGQPANPASCPAGTVISVWHKTGNNLILVHVCTTVGDNVNVNSKNGTLPHAPVYPWSEVLKEYSSSPLRPQGATVVIKCYVKTC